MEKSKILFFGAGCLIAIILLSSCKKEDLNIYDCAGTTPTYTADIKVILDTNCAISKCHDASTKKKKIDLSNYISAKSESTNSRFLGAIQHKKGYTNMPRKAEMLEASLVEKISCWVLNGSPE